MGRLANHSYRLVVKKLKTFGFELYRNAAGSHEIWYNPTANRYTAFPNHPGDMPEGPLRAVLKPAAIDPEAFLAA